MKTGKKIIVGFIILTFIGIAAVYFTTNSKEKKLKAPLQNKTSKSDSSTISDDEATLTEIGAKPEINQKNGSIPVVEEFVKSTVKNPSTYKFYEWSGITSEKGYWKVKCKYRGISSFDKEVTTSAWFYIRNNKVVYQKIVSKI
jgi:hypothetical protein